MARQKIVDETANDGVRLVTQFCNYPADQRAAGTVPLQIDRAVGLLAVNFRPAMRAPGTLMLGWNQTEFFQTRIGHNLFA